MIQTRAAVSTEGRFVPHDGWSWNGQACRSWSAWSNRCQRFRGFQGLREPQPKGLDFRRAAAVFGAAAIAGLYWARGTPVAEGSVEEEWNSAITKLGVEPVYPPEEDINVGDVFAIVTYDSLPQFGIVNSALANHAVRLWRIDLSEAVASNYKNTYVFPRNASGTPLKEGVASQPSSSSIFNLVDQRSELPIVSFPRFGVSDSRGAKFNGPGFFFSGFWSAEANSNAEMEVSITRTQTYGIPYLVAQNALLNFCTKQFGSACEDFAVRTALSTRMGSQIWECSVNKDTKEKSYRMKVEVGVINRVFLTSAIETRLVRGREIAGQAATQRPSPKPAPGARTTNPSGKDEGGGADGKTDAASASGSASERDELAVLFDGTPLDRPVAFAFESVRYTPSVRNGPKSCLYL
jgi:hypothetical protein